MVMVLLNLNVSLKWGGGGESKFWDAINKLSNIDENWNSCMTGVI